MAEPVIIEHKLLKGNASIVRGNSRFKTDINETQTSSTFKHHSALDNLGLALVFVGSFSPTYSFSNDLPSTRIIKECVTSGNIIRIVNPNMDNQKFETNLWNKVKMMIAENREESALFYIYESLNNQLKNPLVCDSFLKISLEIQMNSDFIVHIINALTPIKNKLYNWNAFISYSTALLTEELGENEANILLKAIIK